MKICILGAGESGVGAALLAKQLGHSVFVSDGGAILKKFRMEMIENQIDFEAQTHSFDKILVADLVIKSPGIPDEAYVVSACHENNIPVISEIEFAARNTKAKIIAITGSNGKTTTTLLTHHILENAGFNVGIGGNIGESFARLLTDKIKDYYVLELSSFQLDGCPTLKPNIAILLNITPDHLDRYNGKMENYIASKLLITKNQDEKDYLIYNGQDVNVKAGLKNQKTIANLIPTPENLMQNNLLQLTEEMLINLEGCSLKGPHNQFNIYCALKVAQLLGVEKESMESSLAEFSNAPHRLELVATLNDVEFINDSKATNVDATFYALQSMIRPIIWIAGGVDKGNEYDQVLTVVKEKVKCLICLGKDNSKLKNYFGDHIDEIYSCDSMQKTVDKACEMASEGDVVLLSPACASFDLFRNYIDRGDQFKEYIKKL